MIKPVADFDTELAALRAGSHPALRLEAAGLVDSVKDGLWVNYRLADGRESPYAASLLGNLRHWLNDADEVSALMDGIGGIDRFQILNRN